MRKPTADERPKILTANTPSDGEIPVIRWSNRRKMAWNAFYILIAATFIYWFILPLWFHWWQLPTTWLTIIGDSYFWFATGMIAVIIGYMGFTSLPFWGSGVTMRGTPSTGSRQTEVYVDDD
jgi:hypothetical protein